MMRVHEVTLTYETVLEWCVKFGQMFANDLRRCRPRREINGIWMKSVSELKVRFNIYGELEIRKAWSWIFWYNLEEIREQRKSSFASPLKGLG